MVIGFDASRAFTPVRTGTENYSFQLLKALAQIDTENRYLIYIRDKAVIPSVVLESSVSGKSRSLIKSEMTGSGWPENFEFRVINLPRLWTQVGLAFRSFIDPLDVLFVPSHTLPLIRKPGLKTVITVHDLGAEYLPAFHQLKQTLYLNLMTHYQLKTATKLIAVSQATKKDIVSRVGIEEKKIKVVYEGVDHNLFKPMSKDAVNDIVKTFDLERGKYFLFVGTIQPRKNLERLIRAFAEFLTVDHHLNNLQSSIFKKKSSTIHNPTSRFKLVLVGQKGWKSEAIYSLPKQLGIQDQVVFAGRISDQDLAGLYNGALSLTYPSLFEGFGLPITEAFSCGCPVITSSVSSMPEIAGKAAILVDPSDLDAISSAMQKLYSDDIFRANLIKKGSVRSIEFNWQKTAKETIDILTKL